MLLKLDRALSIVLLLGALGHTLGSVRFYAGEPLTLLWALCASLLLVLIAAVNLLRTARPLDRALAWVSVAATASWLGVSVAFALVTGKPFDPRVVIFVALSLGLIVLGLSDALRSSGPQASITGA
jgi:hypothetical protein